MKSLATVTKAEGIHVIRADIADIAAALTYGWDHRDQLHDDASSIRPASSWYAGYSHTDFKRLLHDGDSALVTDVLAELDLAISDEAPTLEIARAQQGFYPCVPAYLARQPDAMYTLRTATSPHRKALTLFYNVGFSGGTNSTIVRDYGHEVMKVINQLHAERVDVSLYGYVYCGASDSRDKSKGNVLTVVEIQRSQDAFTPERIAATMPSSFCRRGIFGLWEHLAYANRDETCKSMVNNCYGFHNRELEIRELKAALPDLDTDSIVLIPSVSVHVNPAQIWEPINLKLGRDTQ